jgi:hypothetical protein
MEMQLRANDHKGGWENMSAVALIGRARQELSELYEETLTHECGTGAHVLEEAADVANFCMMVADVCGVLLPTIIADETGKESDTSHLPWKR